MNNPKYLNGVLTVIAVCLVILTLSVIGVFPKANAASSAHYTLVPVNPDGTVNVKIAGGSDVNITKIAGQEITPAPAPYGGSVGSLPIRK